MKLAREHATSMRSVDGIGSLTALLADSDAMHRLHRFAESHARLPYKSEEARDIVADAVAAVIARHARREDDDADGLRQELRREVRRRAQRTTSKRARRERLVLYEDLPEHHLASVGDAPEEELRSTPPQRDARAIVSTIRRLAARDLQVVQLLDALVADERRARDPRRFGMTQRTYRSARERLRAYAVLAAAMPGSMITDSAVDDREAPRP